MEQSQSKQKVYKPFQIILYFVLTFLITWSLLIPWAKGSQSGDSLALPCACYSPFLAAVIVIWISKGWTELRHWLVKIFFRLRISIILSLAVALFLPFVIGGLEYGLYRLLGGTRYFADTLSWDLYPANLILIFLLYGGNEEPGWRGFALPALLEWFHPLMASIILGVIHSAWHLPLLPHYGTTFGWYLFNLIPLTIVVNWLYLKSSENVIPVMLFHAGTNAIGNFIPIASVVLGGLGTDLFLRALVYWAIAISVIILTKGRLGADSNNTQLGI
jgi:membrane protease YdiL (CAAX protease family)